MHGVTWFTPCAHMDHMMPCSLGTWRCTDETGQHSLFSHITWHTLDQSESLNSDRDRTKGNFTVLEEHSHGRGGANWNIQFSHLWVSSLTNDHIMTIESVTREIQIVLILLSEFLTSSCINIIHTCYYIMCMQQIAKKKNKKSVVSLNKHNKVK